MRYLISAFLVVSLFISVWLLMSDGLESVHRLMIYVNSHVQNADKKPLWLIVYAGLCVFSQLLVVPSGSLILIAAGFIFSPLLAAGIFSVAQVLCSWPVYKLGEIISCRYPDRFDKLTTRFGLPADWQKEIDNEGFIATMVIRLTPVIPSAAACLLAAGMGISLQRFIPATIAVCWIRPLFFACLGGSLQALSEIPEVMDTTSALQPLVLLFFAALVLLFARLFIRYKAHNT